MNIKKDWWIVAQLAIIVIGVSFTVWVGWLAPCRSLGWLPLKDLPARCLQ